MRALDPRLAPPRPAGPRAARRSTSCSGSRRRCSSSRRRRCSRTIVARAFDGASLGAVGTDARAARARFRGARRCSPGRSRSPGARAAADVLSELRLELVERRLRAQPAALDGVEAAEIAAAARPGRRRARGATSRATCRRSCSPCVVPLAVLGWVASSTSLSALVMLADAAARARVHVADRPLHRASATRERWQALRAPLDALPRRRARAADAARVQPRPRAGRADRARSSERYRRGDDGDAAGRASSRARCSSWRRRSASRSSP